MGVIWRNGLPAPIKPLVANEPTSAEQIERTAAKLQGFDRLIDVELELFVAADNGEDIGVGPFPVFGNRRKNSPAFFCRLFFLPESSRRSTLT